MSRPPPRALAWGHALFFTVVATLAVLVTWQDWQHLARALSRPFHSGTPPAWAFLLTSATAGVASLFVWGFALRRRTVPLWLSGVILAAWVASLPSAGVPRERRTSAGANLALLEAAQRAHRTMVERLQQAAAVPAEREVWLSALGEGSPVRDRSFSTVPYQVVLLDTPNARPPVGPGTFLVWVSQDQVQFEVTPVGFDARGRGAPLIDAEGRELTLRGVFNPDRR